MSVYKLVGLPKDKCDKFTVIIVADKNDGDYLTTINTYDSKRFNERVAPELENLLLNFSRSHALYDVDFDEFEYIDIPSDTESGENCHSLEDVRVQYVDTNGVLWDVDFGVN